MLRLLKNGKLSNKEISEGLGIAVEVVNALEEETRAVVSLLRRTEIIERILSSNSKAFDERV